MDSRVPPKPFFRTGTMESEGSVSIAIARLTNSSERNVLNLKTDVSKIIATIPADKMRSAERIPIFALKISKYFGG